MDLVDFDMRNSDRVRYLQMISLSCERNLKDDIQTIWTTQLMTSRFDIQKVEKEENLQRLLYIFAGISCQQVKLNKAKESNV